MSSFYKLVGKVVVPCSSQEWQEQFREMNQQDKRHIKREKINDVFVSTVFFGIHDGGIHDKPRPFETMVYKENSPSMLYQAKYNTYDEAIAGHDEAKNRVINGDFDD